MKYSALKAAVISNVARGDVEAQIPTFLELAEQRIYSGTREVRGLRTQEMLTTVDPHTVGTTLPTDLLDIERVSLLYGGIRVSLERAGADDLAARESYAGPPGWYDVRGDKLVVGPTFTSTVQLLYFAKPATPSADTDENVVMRTYPSVYLYSLLMEAYTWNKADDDLQRCTALWTAAQIAAQADADRQRQGRGPLVQRVRMTVRV